VIGLDTNILARYYVEDEADAEAAKQHEAARRLMESGEALMVSKTVLLELEWVMRGYYRLGPDRILLVFGHLLSLAQVQIEDRAAVEQALDHYADGLDFADCLHHASYSGCDRMATFDDRRFARRARRLGMLPAVTLLL
jgi:predicted nucleic-acid-binding protein